MFNRNIEQAIAEYPFIFIPTLFNASKSLSILTILAISTSTFFIVNNIYNIYKTASRSEHYYSFHMNKWAQKGFLYVDQKA